jgi:hypothetical protein
MSVRVTFGSTKVDRTTPPDVFDAALRARSIANRFGRFVRFRSESRVQGANSGARTRIFFTSLMGAIDACLQRIGMRSMQYVQWRYARVKQNADSSETGISSMFLYDFEKLKTSAAIMLFVVHERCVLCSLPRANSIANGAVCTASKVSR